MSLLLNWQSPTSRQIFPRWVLQFDQKDLLFTPPSLDLLLASDGWYGFAKRDGRSGIGW
jgi:hypothetical protein